MGIEKPQTNGQPEATNKYILSGLKKKLGASKGLWADSLCEVLWSYYTMPHFSTGESPFKLTFESDVMIPVELGEPSYRRDNLLSKTTREPQVQSGPGKSGRQPICVSIASKIQHKGRLQENFLQTGKAPIASKKALQQESTS